MNEYVHSYIPHFSFLRWLECHGMPCETWHMVRLKLGILDRVIHTPPGVPWNSSAVIPAPSDATLLGCAMFTEEQVNSLLEENMRARGMGNRKKRAAVVNEAVEKHLVN